MFEASIAPFGCSRAHQGVELVDKEDDLSVSLGHFLQNCFKTILEFSAEFRPGYQSAQIKRHEPLSFSPSGTSPMMIRSASASTMAVFPTPGTPISIGLFLVRR
jgi:hypothetical protein